MMHEIQMDKDKLINEGANTNVNIIEDNWHNSYLPSQNKTGTLY